MLKKGILIAFVGIDGAGKTTHSKLLFEYVRNYITPSGLVKAYTTTDAGVLRKYKKQWDDVSLTLFFQILHRFQNNKAKNILDKKGLVVADKWNEVYFAYHNHFGFLAKNPYLRKMLDAVTFSERKPDLCFYLRATPETLKHRLTIRKHKKDSDFTALKNMDLLFSFFEKEAKKNKWIVIDAEKSVKENAVSIRRVVDACLAKNIIKKK